MEAHNQDILLSLLLITALAAVVPMISTRMQRLRIPVVVGEILVGIVIGKSGLNLIEANPILDFLAWFGFIFLMFLSGLELDFSLLVLPKQKEGSFWRQPVPMAVGVFLLTLTLGLVFGILFRRAGVVTDTFLMDLILSTTSLGVVVPVLKEHRLVTSRYGQVILISALLADFVTLLLLSIDIALLSTGFTLDLLLILVLLAAFAMAVRGSQKLSSQPIIHRLTEELQHATAQIEVRGSFALMVAWAGLASVLGVEVILGAFLAGAIVSLSTDRHDSVLREKLDAIGYGFFIPIFFIMVGANFDAAALFASSDRLLLIPLLLFAAFAVKFGAALLFRLEFDWRHTLASGALLSSRLSLIIAASAIALNLGVIDPAVNAAIILVAIVTVTVSPILFDKLLPVAVIEGERHGIIVVGSRDLVLLLARRLATHEPVTLINRRGETMQDDMVLCVTGQADDADVLRRAGAETASALVSLSRSSDYNRRVCALAVERFGIERVVTWSENGENTDLLEELGVRVVIPQLATVLSLEGAIRFPSSFDLLTHRDSDLEIGEVKVINRNLHGRPLRDLHLPGDVLVMGIKRGVQHIVPHGETLLLVEDVVMLVGSQHHLDEAMDWLREAMEV